MATGAANYEASRRAARADAVLGSIAESAYALLPQDSYTRCIVDGIASGLVLISRDMRVMYVNRWLREQCGPFAPASPPRCHAFFRHPPLSEPCPGCPALKTLSDGQVHTLEANPDSRKPYAWYRMITSPILGPEGQTMGVVELVVDITETKQLERKLQSAEALSRELSEYWRRVLEQFWLGVLTLDFQGNVLSWNHGAERLSGLPADEAVGRNISDLLVPGTDAFWPEPMLITRESGFWEGTIRLKSTREDPVWVHTHISLMRNENAAPAGCIVVMADISQEFELQRRLRGSEKRLAAVVEHAPFNVGAADRRGIVTIWNAGAELSSGIPKSVAIGSKLEDLLPNDPHCRRFLDGMAEVFRSRRIVQFEECQPLSLGPRKGEESQEMIWLVPVVGLDGDVEECVWFLWDATEFKRLERQLVRAERLASLGTLAGGIAHECNNIMGSIQLYTQLALKKGDLESATRALRVVLEGTARAKKMAQSLLAFSSDRPLSPRLTNINDLIENTFLLLEGELKHRGISIVRDYEELPQVLVDPDKMGQVFLNLITNGRDAMISRGGTLTVQTRQNNGRLLISFSDTGCGIPQDIVSRVFEPFFTTKGLGSGSPIPGTGLGLSIAHGIARDHSGSISVLSHEGEGSTFIVDIAFRTE